MISREILNNINSSDEYNQWVMQANTDDNNIDGSYGVSQDNMPSAFDTSKTYMAMKQRSPMVMEYYKKNSSTGEIQLKSITLYINPSKMSISNQQLISKQVTRAGIFYHYWGADNSIMAISGSTGLSGMAGIKQLEEIYYASGSLLRYNNYTPTQIYGEVDSYKIFDYKDPIEVANNVINSSNYNRDVIGDIQNNIYNYHQNDFGPDYSQICISLLDSHKDNVDISNMINTSMPEIYSELNEWNLNTPRVHYRRYYQKLIDKLQQEMPEVNDSIVVNVAYELSLQKIYDNQPEIDKSEIIDNIDKNTLMNFIKFRNLRNDAIQQHLQNLKSFQERENKIRDFLRSGQINLKDEMQDEWLPRQITIYFENRAYIGHFEGFNYSRDAALTIINYDMRFIITKQYEFDNVNSSNSLDYLTTLTTINPTVYSEKTLDSNSNVTDVPAINSNSDKNLYTVQDNDTLNIIASKFYGDSSLWPEIYAVNLNIIDNPDLIVPGWQLTIPELSSNYKHWVVLEGNTLSSISRRFYGDSSYYRTIYEANTDVISNPDLIYPKQVLKIPNL